MLQEEADCKTDWDLIMNFNLASQEECTDIVDSGGVWSTIHKEDFLSEYLQS